MLLMVGHALADYEWAGAYIKWTNITRNAHISSCKQQPPGAFQGELFLHEGIYFVLLKNYTLLTVRPSQDQFNNCLLYTSRCV